MKYKAAAMLISFHFHRPIKYEITKIGLFASVQLNSLTTDERRLLNINIKNIF